MRPPNPRQTAPSNLPNQSQNLLDGGEMNDPVAFLSVTGLAVMRFCLCVSACEGLSDDEVKRLPELIRRYENLKRFLDDISEAE
jgi:hypothetical protein